MNFIGMKLGIFFVGLVYFFAGCTESYEDSAPIKDVKVISGKFSAYITDEEGAPLEGVSVILLEQEEKSMSDKAGEFVFQDIGLHNDMLIMKKEGYYNGLFSSSLLQEEKSEVFVLKRKKSTNVRMLFTGDLSFARRFMDQNSPDRTDTLVTQSSSNAVLQLDNLLNDGKSLTRSVEPLFHSVDFPIVNFESIATSDQRTLDGIHPSKEYAYYTDSRYVEILNNLDINYVTLGNNHVYDYGDLGVLDTFSALDTHGIQYSGAGLNVEEAFLPYRTTIKSAPFSLIGATSVRGSQHDVLYVASDHQEESTTKSIQGGAADATDLLRVSSILGNERNNGSFVIYQFHGGKEYTFSPTAHTLNLMGHAVDHGAQLIISHHPHTPQGYGMKDGVLVAYGLGNFIFDQDRLDTLLSHILVVDVEDQNVTQASGYPIYIKDYQPKFVTGDTANRFIRQISESSRNGSVLLEEALEKDFLVFPYQYKEYLVLDGKYKKEKRTIDINITISSKGYETVDLRQMISSEHSLSQISTDDSVMVTMGRDILKFGNFEDDDIDENFYENSIWNFSSSVTSSSHAYHGNAAARIYSHETYKQSSLLYFGRRIRPIGDAANRPNKKLSFLGYMNGEKSAPFSMEARYYASKGDLTFGEEVLVASEGGTFGWKKFENTMTMPADSVISSDPDTFLSQNARALKLFIRMDVPLDGSAKLFLDELAVISWEEEYETKKGPVKLSTPHARDFIRVEGSPGNYKLSLEFTKYLP